MGDAVVQEAQASGATAVADVTFIDSREHVVVAQNTPLLARCFLAKPLSVVHAEESEGVLERSLGFWDLFALGFGGTVGRCVQLCLVPSFVLGEQPYCFFQVGFIGACVSVLKTPKTLHWSLRAVSFSPE